MKMSLHFNLKNYYTVLKILQNKNVFHFTNTVTLTTLKYILLMFNCKMRNYYLQWSLCNKPPNKTQQPCRHHYQYNVIFMFSNVTFFLYID